MFNMPNYKELNIYELTDGFLELMRRSNELEHVTYSVFDSLMQEALLDVIFEFHYGLKTNKCDNIANIPVNESESSVINEPGLDIFGQSVVKDDQYFICPNSICKKNVCSAKYTKHLQACMGIEGPRKSSRISQRKGPNLNSSYSGNGASYDDDEYESEKEARKKSSARNRGNKKSSKKKGRVI